MAIDFPQSIDSQLKIHQKIIPIEEDVRYDLHTLILTWESYQLIEPVTHWEDLNDIKNPVLNLVSTQDDLKKIAISKKIQLKNGDIFEFNSEWNMIYYRKNSIDNSGEIRKFSSPWFSNPFSSIQSIKYHDTWLKVSVLLNIGFVLDRYEFEKILIAADQWNNYIRRKWDLKRDGSLYTHNLFVKKKW